MFETRMADLIPDGKIGEWEIVNYEVTPEESRFTALRATQHPNEYVAAGRYCSLRHQGAFIMSDTRNEKQTNRELIYNAHGRVLIGGLGIGMVLLELQKKLDVTEIVVVEKYQEVIDLVAPHLPLVDKVKIVCADVFDYQPEGVFNAIYMDIWGDISGDKAPEYRRLARRYAKYKDKSDPDYWNGAWCKREVYAHARS